MMPGLDHNDCVAAERGYIDDVIMPHATRKRIARAMLKNIHVELPGPLVS